MDQFLSLIGMQAVRLAVRSGITVTSSYALKQYSNFIQTVNDEQLLVELKALQFILDSKIKIITPAIDLIELRSGQGNSALESALSLTTSMQRKIILLGHQITVLARLQPDHLTIQHMIKDIKDLIHQIDSSIPLLQLAISASGETLSSALPESVSPSRMLQASAFLMIADTQFAANPHETVQVGPDFIVSVYMIFKGYSFSSRKTASDKSESWFSEVEYIQRPIWQEVLHKARLRLHRMPNLPIKEHESDAEPRRQEYLYCIEFSQDRNDGRAHCDDLGSDTTDLADAIPATQITKLFYTNSASILNIKDDSEASNTPVLLIKRMPDASNPRHDLVSHETRDKVQQCPVDDQQSEECGEERQEEYEAANGDARNDSKQFPSCLDPEWIALEMFSADESTHEDGDDTSETSETESAKSHIDTTRDSLRDNESTSSADSVVSSPKSLSLSLNVVASGDDSTTQHVSAVQPDSDGTCHVATGPFSTVTTSLSLLELMIRLAVLQEMQQKSHLSIPDHILSHFLSGAMQSKKE